MRAGPTASDPATSRGIRSDPSASPPYFRCFVECATPSVMRARVILVLIFVVMAAAGISVGCGGNDLVIGGMLPASPTVGPTATPSCTVSGDVCANNSECCSGVCDFTGLCQ